jgi:UDP-N-acetylglucosamine/UDP-N-acetylgalactosamine diphosphorylase
MSEAPLTEDLTLRLRATRKILKSIQQEHLLEHAHGCSVESLEALLDHCDEIDLPSANAFMKKATDSDFQAPPLDSITPAKIISRHPKDEEELRTIGQALIDEGKVAAFTVAGGQGTRLGWNGPKGSFPAAPLTGKPLFRLFAEQILAAGQRAGRTLPWYIMTSPINDTDTRAFFRDNNYFGLDRTDIFMFPQGVFPSFDDDGKFMLASPERIAVNPDGHGGSLRALRNSGAIEDMQARGIEQISYFQVDNPSVRALDPLFLGLHVDAQRSSGEMSSKMIPKNSPGEKVGVFCSVDDRTCVIEYSDLPEELAQATDESDDLRFIAGSIAIHALSVDFVDRITAKESTDSLPLHKAHKKVPYYLPGEDRIVSPETPNATKLEMFIFDAIPLAGRSLVYETDRVEEFAPIKNSEGVDSAESSHQLQLERSARWLETAGHEFPRGKDGQRLADVEISALTAMEPADLKTSSDVPELISAGDQLAF